MNNFDEALGLVDSILTTEDNKTDRVMMQDCCGESDEIQDAIKALLNAHPDSLLKAQKDLQQAFINHLGTDAQAEDIKQAALQADWIDSGRSNCGLIRRVA